MYYLLYWQHYNIHAGIEHKILNIHVQLMLQNIDVSSHYNIHLISSMVMRLINFFPRIYYLRMYGLTNSIITCYASELGMTVIIMK